MKRNKNKYRGRQEGSGAAGHGRHGAPAYLPAAGRGRPGAAAAGHHLGGGGGREAAARRRITCSASPAGGWCICSASLPAPTPDASRRRPAPARPPGWPPPSRGCCRRRRLHPASPRPPPGPVARGRRRRTKERSPPTWGGCCCGCCCCCRRPRSPPPSPWSPAAEGANPLRPRPPLVPGKALTHGRRRERERGGARGRRGRAAAGEGTARRPSPGAGGRWAAVGALLWVCAGCALSAGGAAALRGLRTYSHTAGEWVPAARSPWHYKSCASQSATLGRRAVLGADGCTRVPVATERGTEEAAVCDATQAVHAKMCVPSSTGAGAVPSTLRMQRDTVQSQNH